MEFRYFSALAVVCAVIAIAVAEPWIPSKKYKTNCFSDVDDGKCESSWVKICGDYYACDMLIHFDHPIKRIGYIDDHIYVTGGSDTFAIDEELQQAHRVKKVIPPWGEIIDNHGNKYYAVDGTTYVGVKETGKEIEIITTGEFSSNQLALDVKANKLFILTFRQNERKDTTVGTLFAITLDPLPIKHGKILAEKVEEDDRMTAMAVQGSLEKLLLGAKTEKGGRLIRLNRLKENPCSTKAVIFNVLNEAGYELLKAVEESTAVSTRSLPSFAHNSKALELENSRLKRELNITTAKFNAFSSKIHSLSHKVRPQKGVFAPAPVLLRDGDIHHKEKEECLPYSEVEFMRHQIESLKENEKRLIHKLDDFSSGLQTIVNDPIIESHTIPVEDDSEYHE